MKFRVMYFVIAILMIPPFCIAASDVPTNVTLSASLDTILVDWTGDNDADEYIVYWGTASENLNTSARVDDSETEYTITGLDSGTTYYVAVSSVDGSTESDKSDTQSVITSSDTDAPAIPGGLGVTDINGITESSVPLKWNQNSESDLGHYNISYGTTPGNYNSVLEADADASSFVISGLTNAKRYYFTISAVDTSGNESDNADELIVDTLEDVLPPNTPAGISGALTDNDEITVNIINGNSQMADYSGNIFYYGTVSGNLDKQEDIGKSLSFTLNDLPDDTTWYFAASSYDAGGNESPLTSEISVDVEGIDQFIDQSDDFDGGCFIGTTDEMNILFFWVWIFLSGGLALLFNVSSGVLKKIKIVLVIFISIFVFAQTSNAEEFDIPGKNMVGVSVGYYIPAESDFEDFYGEDTFPVFAFYERTLFKYISIDIESGFLKENGNLLTESGKNTGVDSDITIVPVSASLKFNIEIMPYVVGYIGAGPDYWYCQEETGNEIMYPEIEEWVGGYHGKAGVKLYNTDKDYEGTGVILEGSYSQIDRFGDNKTDIGGWTFKFGFFYQF